MSPAERRKALSGRVRELAAQSSLGKGERAVKDAERNQASRQVREGLKNKEKEREKKQLEEVRFILITFALLLKDFIIGKGSRHLPSNTEKAL
jgi:hypothetical protein